MGMQDIIDGLRERRKGLLAENPNFSLGATDCTGTRDIWPGQQSEAVEHDAAAQTILEGLREADF